MKNRNDGRTHECEWVKKRRERVACPRSSRSNKESTEANVESFPWCRATLMATVRQHCRSIVFKKKKRPGCNTHEWHPLRSRSIRSGCRRTPRRHFASGGEPVINVADVAKKQVIYTQVGCCPAPNKSALICALIWAGIDSRRRNRLVVF